MFSLASLFRPTPVAAPPVPHAVVKTKLKQVHGTWLAICIGIVGPAEGLREKAYRDPVGIPTICFGETLNVHMGDVKSAAECKALLGDRLQVFNEGVNSCVHVPMSDARRAAVVSFTYNVGVGSFCGSTFAKRLNAHDEHACDELLKWTKATYLGRRITLPGLVNRRNEELKYCEAA